MYTSYFGFREKPFNVTPDPRVFYTNHGYQEAYANLHYGILQRMGFMVLTGEVGTGKTTILRRLMDNLDTSARFVFFYNTTLSFEELLTFICDELSLQVHGRGRLDKIQALNQFLLDQSRKGLTAVLCIDEAQNLSETVFENLRLLSNLETSTEKLLQIVLAGQPELEIKLNQPELRQLKQRIALRWRLDRLSEEEVATYIDFRLRAVDYQGRALFSRDAIEEITRYSCGIPRLINIICDNALLIAYGGSQKRVSASIVREVGADLRLASESESPSHRSWFGYKNNHKRDDAVVSEDFASLGAAGKVQKVVAPANPTDGSISGGLPLSSVVVDRFPSLPFLEFLTKALTEAMGPMAPLVLEEHLIARGVSPAAFPKRKAQELVESVSSEILDDVLKAGFQERMSLAMSSLNGGPDRFVPQAK